MASQVYLYLSAVAPPTILLTGPGMPHVLSPMIGVFLSSHVFKKGFYTVNKKKRTPENVRLPLKI